MTSTSIFQSVAEHIDMQSGRSPEVVAIVDRSTELTYRGLKERTDQIAHELVGRGVKPSDIVAIQMNRSIDMLVALVAILKAGAAYLPLEPDAPVARVEEILNLSDAILLITDATRMCTSVPVLSFDEVEFTNACTSGKFIVPHVVPDAPISVFFTSGSTGKPKGVLSTQIGWLNRMLWMQAQYGLEVGDRVLHKTTVSFDDSAVELLWPLMVGACVAILPPELHRDPRAIVDEAILHQSRVLHFVPSMLAHFLDALDAGDIGQLQCLDVVISSGEALHPELVEKFFKKLRNVRLFNQWGATEASIDTTFFECDLNVIRALGKVPIGNPVTNNRVYLLDPQLNPVLEGEVGELYISGVGVGLGYLGDTKKTEEVFSNDPFVPGEQMYRTGDFGQRQGEHIVFMGRNDSQVKIRGNRVELLEVEALLLRHHCVDACVVTAVKVGADLRVVAFIRGEGRVEIEDLMTYLATFLPAYMVPARIIPVSEFPYSQSGKIDRRALAVLHDRPLLNTNYSEPVGTVEPVVAAVFEHVLGLSQVGAEDKFIFLGGNSLDATRVSAYLAEKFGVRIPVNVILMNATVRELALKLSLYATRSQAVSSNGLADPAPWPVETIKERSIMSNAEHRLSFLHYLDHSHRIGALLAYEITGPLDTDVLRQSFEEIAHLHPALRTAFKDVGGTLNANVSNTLPIDFSVFELQDKAENLVRDLIDGFYLKHFDLEKAPLWRVMTLKRSPDDWLLLFSIHPIITDGWSNAILTTDLAEAYRSLMPGGEESTTTRCSATYAEYCKWVEINIDSPYFENQRRFWEKTLPKHVPGLELPKIVDTGGAASVGDESDVALYDLTAKRYARLRAFAHEQGLTTYVVLLSAIKAFLYRASGEPNVSICTPMSGRTHPKLDYIVGPVVNPVVLYSDLSKTADYHGFLSQLRETAADAYDNQSYPFDLIVEERRQRGLHDSLYSVVFVVQNYEVELDLPGMTINSVFLDDTLKNPGPLQDVASEIALHIEAFERNKTVMLRVRFRQPDIKRDDVDIYMRSLFAVIDCAVEGQRAWHDIDSAIERSGLRLRKRDEVALDDNLLQSLFSESKT